MRTFRQLLALIDDKCQFSSINLPCGQPTSGNISTACRACSSHLLQRSRSGRQLHNAKGKWARQRLCSDYFLSLHNRMRDVGLRKKVTEWSWGYRLSRVVRDIGTTASEDQQKGLKAFASRPFHNTQTADCQLTLKRPTSPCCCSARRASSRLVTAVCSAPALTWMTSELMSSTLRWISSATKLCSSAAEAT